MPCPTPSGSHYVMTFLSALATPIARRLEIWLPNESHDLLQRSSGFCESEGTLGALEQGVARGEGPVGLAFLTGVPALQAGAADPAETPDGSAMVAIPVLQQGRLSAVLALYF